MLSDDCAFPFSPQTFSGIFRPFESSLIRLGANYQNEVRPFYLPVHPLGPSFGRRRFVLIKLAVNSFCTQAVGESKHAVNVLRRVVCVAYENLRRFRVRGCH